MIVGTSYFVSFDAACRYYARQHETATQVAAKLAEGLINIGRPPLKPNQHTCLLDGGTRYAVVDGAHAPNFHALAETTKRHEPQRTSKGCSRVAEIGDYVRDVSDPAK